MITSSILRIYSDKLCQNLYETVTVSGSTLQADTSTLQPGQNYWATVTVTDSNAGTSAESSPYKFYSLPNIVFSGISAVQSNAFMHKTTITTNVVNVVDHGIMYTTDHNWSSRPNMVSGNVVEGLTEDTVYYYRPWVKDEFGRIYVNADDTHTTRTLNSVPKVKVIETYTPTDTTFSGRIEVTSSTSVSAVWIEYETGGNTHTLNLVAKTGEQPFEITGLNPFTKYHMVAKATNTAGTGTSTTVYFTTMEQNPTPVPSISVEIANQKVSSIDNAIRATSIAEYSEGITITSSKVYIFDNSYHTGQQVAVFEGGRNDVVTARFEGSEFSGDTTYFIFGYVTYTDGNNNGDLWSEPVKVRTYSMVDYSVTAARTSFTVDYAVDGYSSDTVLEFSINGDSWRRVPLENQQGGNVTVSGLDPGTSYYVRMRVANSERGYSDYVNETVITTNTTVAITGFTQSGSSVIVGIQITQ